MARGQTTSPEIKAQVLAALMTGQGIDKTAEQFHLSPNTVSGWKKEANMRLKVAAKPKSGGDPYSALIDKHLEEALTTLTAMQVHFRDKEWLANQTAEALAVLYGVTCDKVFRMFEAMKNAG